jgi:hypothetical protein
VEVGAVGGERAGEGDDLERAIEGGGFFPVGKADRGDAQAADAGGDVRAVEAAPGDELFEFCTEIVTGVEADGKSTDIAGFPVRRAAKDDEQDERERHSHGEQNTVPC